MAVGNVGQYPKSQRDRSLAIFEGIFRVRTGNDSSTDTRTVFGVVGLDRSAG